MYDLVYRQVFYIWTESILGNLEVALYRGIFPGDINRNGGRRFGLYRISATAHWWDYWTYRIEIINQMKEIRAYDFDMYDIEKEKREAINAGNRALNSLRTARENLNSAKNWGLADMFGGGFFTTMLKHSKMDQAKQNMEQAKYDFRNFSKELDDVNMACNLNIDTGDFLSFADYFFDGFVVDWMVQDRINTARLQVDEAIRRTEYIVNQLQRM